MVIFMVTFMVTFTVSRLHGRHHHKHCHNYPSAHNVDSARPASATRRRQVPEPRPAVILQHEYLTNGCMHHLLLCRSMRHGLSLAVQCWKRATSSSSAGAGEFATTLQATPVSSCCPCCRPSAHHAASGRAWVGHSRACQTCHTC